MKVRFEASRLFPLGNLYFKIPQLTGKNSGKCPVLGMHHEAQSVEFHRFAKNFGIQAAREIRK